jgi:signal transduction histidine kinase
LNLQPTQLGTLIDEMLDFFTPTAKQAGIKITWYPNSETPMVMLDRELIKQALLNLMLNAEQAMPQGGEIILQSHVRPGWLCLDVIDTGCGVAPDRLEKVFQPFYTTKQGGSGLGLATTRKIVEAHGGKISVVSDVGTGTKFTIELPTENVPTRAKQPASE